MRRFFTDNTLLNSGLLLQNYLLRTQTNGKDIRLQFLETEQHQRTEAEQDVELATDTMDVWIPLERLSLPDT